MSTGLFWRDDRPAVTRLMPPIPDTGWQTPRELPNLAAARALAIDCETYDPDLQEHGPGWARGKSHIVGLAVGTDDGCRWYFPIRHTVEPQYNLSPKHVLAWAAVELARPTQPKTGANLIYDVGTLRAEGVHMQGDLFDVEFAEALLDESATVNLEDLGQRYLGRGKTSAQLYDWCRAWYGGGEDQRENIWRAPPRLVGPYAQGDVDLPFHVLDRQWQRLQSEGLLDLFRMECALIPLLVEMRFAGVSVDLTQAEQVRSDLLAASTIEQAKLRSIVGFDVNVNAAASIARAFDQFGYPYERTAKGAPSFDKDFLAACHNPVADTVNEIRKLDKLRTTFVENYILGAHVNGKVYCSFNLLRADETGARSGRFSSTDPNLQNIPVRDKVWGKKLRSLFIPDSGHERWRKFDYCVDPASRVLTSDLRWIRADTVQIGQKLIGFDEYPKQVNAKNRRCLHETIVVRVAQLKQPCYRITTNKGSFVCSALHRWLVRGPSAGSNLRWSETQRLRIGQRMMRVCNTWLPPKVDYAEGWLSGLLDGEGWVSSRVVGFGQNSGPVLDRALDLLDRDGFAYEVTPNKSGCNLVRIIGGRSEFWRCLGKYRPVRLLSKVVPKLVEGVGLQSWLPCDVIQAIEFLGEQSVVSIETDRQTLVVEGLASHNSQIEYRFLVHYAVGPGADEARQKYIDDPATDYHAWVQQLVAPVAGWDLSTADLRKLHRFLTKNLNFGAVYGIGEVHMAELLQKPRREAKQILADYHQALPFVRATMQACIDEVNQLGYITTILGRRSRFDLWESGLERGTQPLSYQDALLQYGQIKRAYAYRSLNRRLQGSAADLFKTAMLKCWTSGVYTCTGVPRLIVHDEKNFSDPGSTDEAFREMKHIMETARTLRVPVRADEERGINWGKLADVTS